MDRHGITRIVDVRFRPWTRRFSLNELSTAFGDSHISRLDMGGLDFEIDQYHEWLDKAAAGVVILEELGKEHKVLGEDGYGVRHL
jgi:hypothetical protein